MGIDGDTENWNKENFTSSNCKKVTFEDTTISFEPLPKKYSFKLVASYSQNDLLSDSDPDDPWTHFREKFIYNDDELTESDILDELWELCSWRDSKDDDDYCDSDEDVEMIKRHLNNEVKYSSPKQQHQQSRPSNAIALRHNSSYINFSSLRLTSSTCLSNKRRQMEDATTNIFCPSKRAFSPFQHLNRKSSMNLDEAIACAAQNLDADISTPIQIRIHKPSKMEQKKSEFWNDLDTVAF